MLKKLGFLSMLVVLFACNAAENKQGADTAAAKAADTMPVLDGMPVDTTSVIRTPSTNDNNVVMPDSAIKNR